MSEPTEPSSLVLTVSVRLARWLTLKYNEDRLNEGLEVWDAPAILPLDTWLKQVWVESLPDRRLLSDLQARKIWETIIRQSLSQDDIPLIHLASSAEQAKEAYQIIVDYGLTASPPDLILNEETRQFFKWKRRYETPLIRPCS
jgi:ATP-dependent helicase/nuclease subunit B